MYSLGTNNVGIVNFKWLMLTFCEPLKNVFLRCMHVWCVTLQREKRLKARIFINCKNQQTVSLSVNIYSASTATVPLNRFLLAS